MWKMELPEIQRIGLNILIDFAEFCDKQGIQYRLAYGTLLGAVRHKGFIPWDDDIDVVMLRKDYEKFSDLMNNRSINDNYDFISIGNNKWNKPYGRLIDINTKAYGCNGKTGIWIDIFPLDCYDELVFKKCYFLRKIIIAKEANHFKLSRKKDVGKLILKGLFSPISIKCIARKIDSLAQSVSQSNMISNMVYSPYRAERIEMKKFVEERSVIFEGHKFRAFADYDTYLKRLYRDYMELPPEENRRSHSMNAYFLGDDLKGYLERSFK